MSVELTGKRKRFVQEYLIDMNATQAAIRAGYSAKTAKSQGSRLMADADIRAELEIRRAEVEKKLELSRDMVIRELAAIGFANGADFAKVVKSGPLQVVEIVLTENLPPDKLPAIAGIKEGANGVEVKLYDKIRALELLGKYLGYLDGNGDKNRASLAELIVSAFSERQS